MKKKNILAVIPARMKSSRFPGKPLADLCGKPMVVWASLAAQKSELISEVVVATDSKEIADACRRYRIESVLTREDHATGTDRLAEVASLRNADIYVNVQGDEPLIEPSTIDAAIYGLLKNRGYEVVNLCAKITNHADLINATVPKVALGPDKQAVFFSRCPIPYPKNPKEAAYYRQVCVYVFTKKSLMNFSSFKQGPLERAEEIELLRFLEYGMPIKMVEVKTRSFGIDMPADLKKAVALLKGAHSR